MNDWELGWYLHACDLARDEAKAESARQEQRRRKERISEPASGQLPIMAHAIVKHELADSCRDAYGRATPRDGVRFL
jgi:hypothetical protein